MSEQLIFRGMTDFSKVSSEDASTELPNSNQTQQIENNEAFQDRKNLLKRKNIRKMPKDVVYLFDPNIGKYYYGKRFALKKSENF